MSLKDELEVLLSKGSLSYHGIQINQELFAAQSKTRVDPLDHDTLLVVKTENEISTVNYVEPFGCCGKVYLFGFMSTFINETTAASFHSMPVYKSLELLFKFATIQAINQGYSYIGFVHLSNSYFVKAAKESGFQEIMNFYNPRSGNTLSEMCKIL